MSFQEKRGELPFILGRVSTIFDLLGALRKYWPLGPSANLEKGRGVLRVRGAMPSPPQMSQESQMVLPADVSMFSQVLVETTGQSQNHLC